MMKPTKVFFQDPESGLYSIDGKEGKTINEDQRQKLMQLLENDFDFITVCFQKLPMDLTRHTIKFNNE